MGDEDTRGWDAIEAAVARVVTDPAPLHWGSNTLPGQTGIYGLSAYRADGHWLYVTFGLTDLFSQGDPGAETSGFGFELTMRVPRTGDQPPTWPVRLLDQLSRYVYGSGRSFAAGHRMDPGGPITGTPDTHLTAVAFAPDPHLPPIVSPFGAAGFLTVVGITADELARMKATSTASVLDAMASPSLVTDPARPRQHTDD